MKRQAKLAYLTQPAPGLFVLNVQTRDQAGLTQYEITTDQLRGLVADGAAMSFRARETVA
jgi:hypothetical protein